MAQQIKLIREELYRKIWEQPTVKVAAEFRISDVGLAKICRKMDVPKPPLGYWRRIETGAKIAPTPLPPADEKTTRFVFLSVSDESDRVSAEVQAKIDFEDKPENQIKIAKHLSDAHPLVKKAQQFYERHTDIELTEPFAAPSGKCYPNISVSPAQITRALLIADAVFKAAEKRGYQVIVSADHWGEETRITKEGEEVRFALCESVRRIKRELTAEEKKKPPYLLNIEDEYQSEGKLTIKINQRWSSYQKWGDRKNEPLENRLNDVLAGIIAMLESLVDEKRKKEEAERQRQEAIRRREEEKQRREQLETHVERWRKSQDMTDYLNAYEIRLIEERGAIIPNTPEAEWLAWARNYAASLDPLNEIFSADE